MSKITLEESATDPDAPDEGKATLFVRSSNKQAHLRDDEGTVTPLGAPANVEALATAGAINTVPTSDGAGGLAMAVPGTAALDAHAANADAHHAEEHAIASHDTDATGAELTALTNGSDTALHGHSIGVLSTVSNDTAARLRPDGSGGIEVVSAPLESLTFTFRNPLAVVVFDQFHRWGFAGIIEQVHVVAHEAISAGDFTFRVRSGADHENYVGGDLVTSLTLDFVTQATEISALGLSHVFSAGHKCAPDITVASGTQPPTDRVAGAMLNVMYRRT